MNFLQQDNPSRMTTQNMALKQKILSVHSYDRDTSKWPHSNNFEIQLPDKIANIHSMRLATIALPNNQYVFSNEYQNTKLTFKLFFKTEENWVDASFSDGSRDAFKNYTIEINEGFYTPDQICAEIQHKMNDLVSKDLVGSNTYTHFSHKYNEVQNKFMFGNNRDSFELLFSEEIEYTNLQCGQKKVFDHVIRWGLPAYLGFDKETYVATDASFAYLDYNYPDRSWLDGTTVGDKSTAYFIEAPNNIDILGEDVIYMEIDKCNTIDELVPYSKNTSGLYNNDYRTNVKSAFAKIPCVASPFSEMHDSAGAGFIKNWVIFTPYIDSLSKLTFKFRYHDGRLVDFKKIPFSFSIEFNTLADSQMAELRQMSEANFAYIENKTRR